MAAKWCDRMVRFLCSLGVLGAVALTSPSISAQEVDVARVLGLIGEANEHFENEVYDKALASYEDAYKLMPDPSLLYRMGLSAEKLNRVVEAVDYYERFIDAVPDDKTAKRVSERLVELREVLPARILFESEPAGAKVYVDSMKTESLGETPLEVDLPAGRSVVFLELEGYETEVRNIDGVKGEKRRISVELSESRALVLVDPNQTSPAAEESEGSGLSTWGWVAAGTGAAVLVTGGVFTFLSMTATDDVNSYDKRAPGASQAEIDGLRDDALSYYDTSVILYAAGGVLAATGATLLILDAVQGDGSASLNVSPTPNGAWVTLQGAF